MWKYFAESEIVRLLTIVALFLPLFKINLNQLPYWVYTALVFGIVLVVLQTLYNIRGYLNLKPMPSASGKLTPFSNSKDFVPWKRSVAEEVAIKLQEASDRHVLLIAPSGAGKSVLLEHLLGMHLTEEVTRCRTITEFETPIISLLNEIERACASEETSSSFYPFIEHDRAGKIFGPDELDKLEKAVASAISGRRLLFIFDQVERYFSLAQKESLRDYNKFISTTEAMKRVLSCIRRSPDARSIYAIRSEFFFGSLGQLFNTGRNGENIEKIVDFFFMNGTNLSEDQTVRAEIDGELRHTRGMSTTQSTLYKVSNFEIPEHSDTFSLRLGLYLFGAVDGEAKEFQRLSIAQETEDFIDILLDLVFQAFLKSMPQRPSRNMFDTVLYALALENKVIGNAATADRISGLAHFPIDEVMQLLAFLVENRLISQHQFEGRDKFRIVHDRISDRLLRSDLLDINPITTESLRFLTETTVDNIKLTIPKNFPKALETTFVGFYNLSYISIVSFVVFGLLRLSFPQETSQFVLGLNGWLGLDQILKQPTYYFEPIYYLPHFFCHVAWVSFIDRVYRGYLVNIPIGWFAKVCSFFAPVGVFLGVCVSFTPAYFFVPIATVGLALGVLAIIATLQLSLKGETQRMSLSYGVRTSMNMLIMFVIFSFLARFHSDLTLVEQLANPLGVQAELFLLILICVESGGLLWFWAHIRAEQNTPKIWSAYLALLDKGLASR